MTKLITSIIGLFFFGTMTSAQLTKFSHGDILSAGSMNKNFDYLIERIETRKITINCPNDNITDALKEYNHIMISGKCSENLLLSADVIPHRFIILEGVTGPSNDGIVALDSSSSVIAAWMGIKIKVKNLTLSGGKHGVYIAAGGFALLESSKIENMSDHGIYSAGAVSVCSNSNIENIEKYSAFNLNGSIGHIEKCQLSGNSSSDTVRFEIGSSGEILDSTINGGKSGLLIDKASSVLIGKSKPVTISGAETGITVSGNSNLEIRNTTVKNISLNGITAKQNSSVFLRGNNTFTQITNNAFDIYINSTLSNEGELNLSNPIKISGNSFIYLNNAKISGDGDSLLMISLGSSGKISNSNLSGNLTSKILGLWNGSSLEIQNSILESTGWSDGINISSHSSLQLFSTSIKTKDNTVYLTDNSHLQIRSNSKLISSERVALDINRGSGARIDSGASIQSTGHIAIRLRENSWLKIKKSNKDNPTIINRTDAGNDIELSDLSSISIDDGNTIGTVVCTGKSFASVSEGTVGLLGDDCK